MKKYVLMAILILGLAVSSMAAEVTIKLVQNPEELPEPFSLFVQKGDYFVSDGQYAAAVAGVSRPRFSTINYDHPDASGYILAFIREGWEERAEAQIGIPSVRLGGEALVIGPSSVQQEGSSIVVRAGCGTGDGLKLEIRTRYSFAFDSGRINIVSEIRNAGSSEATGLSFGLGGSACQNFNFSPFNARSFPRLNFRLWQRPDHVLGWFNPNPLETRDHPLPGKLQPGGTHRVSYTLVVGSEPIEVLNDLYALAGVKPEQVPFEFPNFDGPSEIIIRDPATGAVFYRAFMDRPVVPPVPLPRGTYTIRAHLFPAVIERNFTVDGNPIEKPLALRAPEFGRTRVSIIDESGRPELGKVSFIGLAPCRSPYFKPENPVVTGRGWEGFKNSVFPLRDELDVTLPAGVYLVTASRGPEYTRETRIVEVFSGENPALEFRLEKAVATPGLISIDSHMHTQISDGGMLVSERIRSVVGEGLDVAVATDHNFIVDYRPDLERLGLEDDLAVIAGNEVTARTGSIHYNTFPVTLRPGEPKNGAISVEDETPSTLFGLSRSKDPGTLIHVNHPRSSSLGYFVTYDLEPEKAASVTAPFDIHFEVMEAVNGAKLGEANRLSIEDWFHFLNRGYPIRAVGVSDSHGIDGSEPGYARTYVLYDGPKGAGLDQEALVEALKEGRSFLSNGPIVFVRANGRGLLGDLVPARKGQVELEVRVMGAPWLDVSEVRLIVNGERWDPLPMKGGDGRTVKFRDRIKLTLEKDAWIAVEVRGRGSLYPVIQQRSRDGLAENAANPYALTNPIFFDVDGNGRSDPIWPEKVIVRSENRSSGN